jgi:hypothetical protein
VTRERRRAPRRQPHSSEPVSRVRVRAGRELEVLDISSFGVLVQGESRLLPGRHLDVHVVSCSGRTLVRSRVVRSFVSSLSKDRVVYRGALAFEQPLQLAPAPPDAEDTSAGSTDGNTVPAGTCGSHSEPEAATPVHAS